MTPIFSCVKRVFVKPTDGQQRPSDKKAQFKQNTKGRYEMCGLNRDLRNNNAQATPSNIYVVLQVLNDCSKCTHAKRYCGSS